MSIGKNAVIAVGVAAVIGLGAVGVARATTGPAAGQAAASPNLTVVGGWPVRARVLLFLHRVTNAEATVDIAGTEHTVRLDHGIVRSAGGGEIVLTEGGGAQTVTIPVMAAAIVKLDGRLVQLGRIHAGDVAYVVRVDGHAARGVRAFGPNFAP
jgi:hypothetical protein